MAFTVTVIAPMMSIKCQMINITMAASQMPAIILTTTCVMVTMNFNSRCIGFADYIILELVYDLFSTCSLCYVTLLTDNVFCFRLSYLNSRIQDYVIGYLPSFSLFI